MSGHTPGPWRNSGFMVYALDETGKVNRFSARADGGYVFFRNRGESTPTPYAEVEANARLIAAAPDMLAALKAAEGALIDLGACDTPNCRDCPGVLAQVRAVITKAEGRS